MAGILKRLSRDLRHTSAGMPDLVVWNTDTKRVKVSEGQLYRQVLLPPHISPSWGRCF